MVPISQQNPPATQLARPTLRNATSFQNSHYLCPIYSSPLYSSSYALSTQVRLRDLTLGFCSPHLEAGDVRTALGKVAYCYVMSCKSRVLKRQDMERLRRRTQRGLDFR